MKQVLVITRLASPYQVEFMNHLASFAREIDLHVVYVVRNDSRRSWSQQAIDHEHSYIEGEPSAPEQLRERVASADYVVFAWYQHPLLSKLMHQRASLGKPWAYWGERPGFRGLGPLGGVYRRMKLSALHRSNAAIWGVGEWAIEMWKREFGPSRPYYNVPYFSDLSRFLDFSDIHGKMHHERTILYSGSLIRRKGVDLLAQAFRRIAMQHDSARLLIMGEGPLRPMMERELAPVADQVQFLGFRDWSELHRFYHAADILCAPSRHDGWGVIVPEGLAAGLPVIATDHMGAARDLVRHEENGWVIPAGNLHGLENTLQLAMALDVDRLRKMSSSAYHSALEHTLDKGRQRFLEACGL